MNKHERLLAGNKIAQRRAKACGWKGPLKELPFAAQLAFKTTGYRIPLRDDRKRFGKSSGKRCYGHFGGHGHEKHLDKKSLQERAEIRSHEISIL